MISRPIAMALVALLALGLTATLVVQSSAEPYGPGASEGPEELVVKGKLVRHGPVAIYIHSFPYSYETAQIEYYSPIIISLSVWGASHEDPVLVYCDGREVTAIEEPGYWSIQLALGPGYHHVAISCHYGIFASSTFYVRPRPVRPAPEAIPVPEVQAMLEALRREVWRNCLIAACAGVVTGYGLKRASKIEFKQLYIPFAILITIPFIRLEWLAAIWPSLSVPDLFATAYWLVPFGLTAILAYHFVPDFAEPNKLIELVSPWCIRTREIPTYEGEYIVGLAGLREVFTARRLIRTKPIKLEDAYPIDFDGVVAYIVREIRETDRELIIKCDDALARAFVDAEALRKTSDRMAELEVQVRMYKAALPACIFLTLQSVEKRIKELRQRPELTRQIDRVAREVLREIHQRFGIEHVGGEGS